MVKISAMLQTRLNLLFQEYSDGIFHSHCDNKLSEYGLNL